MKQVNVNFKESIYDIIVQTSKLRGKSISDTVDEIVSDYFYKEDLSNMNEVLFDESKEVWKDVAGYENLYRVSNMGRIASIRYGFKVMALVRNPTGYLQIGFRVNNKITRKLVHVIVADAFLEKCENCTQVDHINNVKYDNRVENLKWISRSDNMKNNYSRGTTTIEKLKSKGKKIELFDRHGNSMGIFPNIRVAAEFIGVNHGNLSAIASNKKGIRTLTKDKITAKLITN